MMTWVSLRSGVASSGTVIIAHQPTRQPPTPRAQTRSLFSTEKSMMWLIMAGSLMAGRQIPLGILLKLVLATLRTEGVGRSAIRRGVARHLGFILVDIHAAGGIFGCGGVIPCGRGLQS